VRLEMGRVDHYRVSSTALIGQFKQHPGEDALLAPTLPPAVEGLVRAIRFRRVSPPQPIAIDEDNSTENALVINTRLAVGLWEKRLQLRHLRIAQPIKVAHVTAPFLEP